MHFLPIALCAGFGLSICAAGHTFGLTAAEGRLTVMLLQGTTMKEASKNLKVSPNTAQSQLKSVFSKVGVHRQAELIRVLLPLVTICNCL
jgi:DNA-binding CsgD family transcriptional regulator